jgi:hypothetical protein
MKLINLDDLVIFGQGSEWLWTMISGLVLAVTFFAIYRQLSLQRNAQAIEQVRGIAREWTDERMSRAKVDVLVGIRDGASPEATMVVGTEVGDFWEGIAYLVRMGNMDARMVYNSLGPTTRVWWGLLGPSAEVARDRANDRGIWVDFEWLAGLFAKYDRKAGEPAAYDAAYIAERVPDLLESNRRAIRLFEELRAVVIRPEAPVAPVSPSRPHRSGARPATSGG